MAKVGELWAIVMPVKVFREFKDGTVDVCDEDGNCFKTIVENLTNKIDNNMKAMKDACLTVAKDLLKANNKVTTLEVKVQARRDYPYFFWDQKTVSSFMDQFAGDGIMTYTDNGTYRTYSLLNPPITVPSVSAKPLTKTVVAGKGTANTVSTTGLTVSKVQKTKIDLWKLQQLIGQPKFAGLTLANGTVVTRQDIKNQKKSPLGYANPKLGKIKSVVVGTTQYNVK